MALYQNKYRIEPARLKDWDYSTPWWYYVTINTKNHKEYFGEVLNNNMVLNVLGKIVENCWLDIPKHYPNVELDNYVVMPNHIHGIIILNESSVETCHGKSLLHGKSLHHGKSLLPDHVSKYGKPIKNSLPMVINHFKGAIKRWCNQNGYNQFAWQARYYDRIIRNEKELFHIRKYIINNILKWELDSIETDNLELL